MKRLFLLIFMVLSLGFTRTFAQTPTADLVYSYGGNDSCAQDGTNPIVYFQLQSPQNVDSFFVNFGNGQTFSGTSATTGFVTVYFSGNTYLVKVKLFNTASGDSSVIFKPIPIYRPLSASLIGVPDSICVGEEIHPYANILGDPSHLTGILWKTSAGYTATNVTKISTSFSSASSPADTIQVITQSVCGNDTVKKTIIASSTPPLTNFSHTLSASDTICPDSYFEIGITFSHFYRKYTMILNWGDGTSDSVVTRKAYSGASHVYASPGKKYLQIKVIPDCGTPLTVTDSIIVGSSQTAYNSWTPTMSYSGQDTVCQAHPIDVSFSSGGNSIITSVNWGDGNTETGVLSFGSHVYSTPGNYEIIATFTNGCGEEKYDTLPIVITNNPGYAPPPELYVSSNNTCVNSVISFYLNSLIPGSVCTLDFGDGNDTTFTAEYANHNFKHQYTSAGTYSTSLTAITPCGDTLNPSFPPSVTVGNAAVNPSFNIYANNKVCTGTPASFSLGILGNIQNFPSIEWDMGDGTTYQDSTSIKHIYTTPGVYYMIVKITDLCGNVFAQTKAVKVENQTIPRKSISVGINPTLCQGTYLYLSPSIKPNATYGDTLIVKYGDGSIDTATAQGIYSSYFSHKYNNAGFFNGSIILHSVCGESDTVTFNLRVKPAPTAVITISDSSLCQGETATLTAQPTNNIPAKYLWSIFPPGSYYSISDSGNSVTFTFDQPGEYFVDIVAQGGSCYFSSPIADTNIFVKDSSTAPVANFTAAVSGNTVTLSNNSSDADFYFWDFGDGNTVWGNVSNYSYVNPGTYTITLIAYRCDTTTGKTDTTTQTVSVTTGINITNPKMTKIYPNPASLNITIKIPTTRAMLSITNLQGQELLKKNISAPVKQIDISRLPAGIYFLNIRFGDRKEVHKLIVE